MSCPRSTASTESAAIFLRASGGRRVAACPAREGAAVALHSPFQPTTCLWQFEGLSTCDCGSHELRLDRDVAVRRPGIWTHLVRRLDQALRHVGRDAGQADVQADRDIVAGA